MFGGAYFWVLFIHLHVCHNTHDYTSIIYLNTNCVHLHAPPRIVLAIASQHFFKLY